MGSIYCTNCGAVNDTSFNVCYNCGTRIHKPVPDTENASVPGTPDNDIQRLDTPYAAMNHRKQYFGDYLNNSAFKNTIDYYNTNIYTPNGFLPMPIPVTEGKGLVSRKEFFKKYCSPVAKKQMSEIIVAFIAIIAFTSIMIFLYFFAALIINNSTTDNNSFKPTEIAYIFLLIADLVFTTILFITHHISMKIASLVSASITTFLLPLYLFIILILLCMVLVINKVDKEYDSYLEQYNRYNPYQPETRQQN